MAGIQEDCAQTDALARVAVPGTSPHPYNFFRGEAGEASDNVLNGQFETTLRHTESATDVTEFTFGSSNVYLSPIVDLRDNRDVSAMAGPAPSVKMVTDGLRVAIDTLSPGEKPLVHSDRLNSDSITTPSGRTRCAMRDSPSPCTTARAKDLTTSNLMRGSDAGFGDI